MTRKAYSQETVSCTTTGACPFAFNDLSERVQNYGCLPTPLEILVMRVEHGKTWACHASPKKPCQGAINTLKARNLPFRVIDERLVTEDDDWTAFTGKASGSLKNVEDAYSATAVEKH